MEAARFDDGVARIYPRMKAFERACNEADIPFALDHVLAQRTHLTEEFVGYAVDPSFATKYVAFRGAT